MICGRPHRLKEGGRADDRRGHPRGSEGAFFAGSGAPRQGAAQHPSLGRVARLLRAFAPRTDRAASDSRWNDLYYCDRVAPNATSVGAAALKKAARHPSPSRSRGAKPALLSGLPLSEEVLAEKAALVAFAERAGVSMEDAIDGLQQLEDAGILQRLADVGILARVLTRK
jgi:hypothetical protein